MELKKQDRNGTRTTTDVERRYKLSEVPSLDAEVEELKKERVVIDTALSSSSTNPVQNKVITENLNKKVNKSDGKGLSTNDFTDSDKNSIHTHSNKSVLDGITSTKVLGWNNKSNLQQTILYNYSYGNIDDVDLYDSVAYYDFIDIVYGNNSNIYDTKRVYEPNGKKIALSMTSNSASNLAIRTENDTISGYSIIRDTRNKIVISSGGAITMTTNANITDADKLMIFKVIGYTL